MFLKSLPLVFVLAGLVLYTVLAGADFGAGAWRLFAGRGANGTAIRDHAQHSMGPVWEANHVWLVFVLVVSWTAYPRFLASLASTLVLPLFIAALGIIVRGASYAVRAAITDERETRRTDTVFGAVSLLTPFALGTCVGALAAHRVPVGNAAGGLFSSWTGPVSLLIGALAVSFCAYLAAVFLAADAKRHGSQQQLIDAMRTRALISGSIAGALSIIGLLVLHADAKQLYHGLTHGAGLIVLISSALAGVATLALMLTNSFEAARYSAAVAVTTVVAGWAIATWPDLLPGLTIKEAAAPYNTLMAVVIAVLAGGALLALSLALLFRLLLQGQLSHESEAPEAPSTNPVPALIAPASALRICIALLIIGVGCLNALDPGWGHIIGVLSLAGFVIVGFLGIAAQSLR